MAAFCLLIGGQELFDERGLPHSCCPEDSNPEQIGEQLASDDTDLGEIERPG